MVNNAKNGFTLAEVLITLVIIGVVAALTIPTAINKYREQSLKSQFIKAYSSISQAIYKTVMEDFYGYARCYYSTTPDYDYTGGGVDFTDCYSFYNAFVKKLSVQKVCIGDARANGCIPQYQSYGSGGGCPGYTRNNIENNSVAHVLSNGQIIISYSNGRGQLISMFLVDVNGHKGPNAYGKDLFSFVIGRNTATNTIVIDRGICEFPVSGGRTTREMIRYALAGKK